MSQQWPSILPPDDVDVTKLTDRFDSLRSLFSGAAAPTDPVYGQPWIDSDNNHIKICTNAVGPVWSALGACMEDNSIAVTKLAATATNRLFGRFTASAGAGEEIALGTGVTVTGGTLDVNVTTILGYTPLNAASYTAADVLAKLLTVDGSGSGIDADLLDGQSGAFYLAFANFTGTITTAQITDDAVTYAKMQNAASAGFIGATGAGDYSHRTYAQVRGDLDLEVGTDFASFATTRQTGVVEIWIPATAMVSRTTNGAADGTVESPTNKVMQKTKDFDQTTQEFVQFTWAPPKSWNVGTVTFIPYCIPAGSSGGWVFGMAGVAISNDDPIEAAFGTAQTSADSFLANTDVHVGPESSAITIGGTPADADLVVFQIERTVSDGGDTHNGDVKLLGIKLRFTVDGVNDT